MKKAFLLLPLSVLVLNACSSSTPAPVTNADGSELTPGVMQPVAGTGSTTSSAGWQSSDVQSTAMPSSMSGSTVASQPTYSTPTVTTPTYSSSSASSSATTSTTKVVCKPTTTTKSSSKKASQDFSIPRDDKNAPIYSQIQKGFYDGDTYTVKKGDTMFLIAYIAGKDVKEVAALNNLSEPYQLNVGQTLKLSNGSSTSSTATTCTTVTTQAAQPVEPAVTYTQGANGTAYGSDGTVTGPVKASTSTVAPSTRTTSGVVAVAGSSSTVKASTSTVKASAGSSSSAAAPASNISWQWPTAGRVVAGFSSAEGGNKGIDIAGSKGQDVKAAAAGRVVYAGNALRGYGNLIIIKHNDDFLSAYAHNDKISVDDQDEVKAGQKIATMGNTGTDSVKLHFEIRYKGKSIDPTRYLPRR